LWPSPYFARSSFSSAAVDVVSAGAAAGRFDVVGFGTRLFIWACIPGPESVTEIASATPARKMRDLFMGSSGGRSLSNGVRSPLATSRVRSPLATLHRIVQRDPVPIAPFEMSAGSTIRDPSLAPEGERKIQWVAQHAHTLNSFARSRLSDGSLKGRRIAIAVHLEAKTAYLAWLFREAGAEVAVTGSNPFSTQDDVCAALVARGLTVHAIHGADPSAFDEHLLAALDFGPDLIVDDGAELVTRLHQYRRDLLPAVRGASEETTSGILRLRAMEREGALEIPVIAANDARCKHLFDNRYGTGQSTLTAILATTNLLLAGKTVVVAGYGWV